MSLYISSFYIFSKVDVNYDIYRVDQKKVCSQKMKNGHGGFFLKKKSMANKIKKFV